MSHKMKDGFMSGVGSKNFQDNFSKIKWNKDEDPKLLKIVLENGKTQLVRIKKSSHVTVLLEFKGCRFIGCADCQCVKGDDDCKILNGDIRYVEEVE